MTQSSPAAPSRPPVLSLTAQTLLLSAGKLLVSLSTLVTAAALTRSLSVGEYATYRQALLLYTAAVPAVTLGVPKALFLALSGEPPGAQRARLAEGAGLLAALGALLGLWLGLWGVGAAAARFGSPGLAALALPVALLALLSAPRLALEPALLCLGATRALVWAQVWAQAAWVVAVVAAAWAWGGAAGALWASVAWAAAALLWGGAQVRGALRAAGAGAGAGAGARRPTLQGARRLLAAGVPLGLASLLGTLSQQLDKYTVSALCPPEEFARYVTGALELPIVGVVTGSMAAALLPELTARYKRGDRAGVLALWQGAMRAATLALAPAMWATLWLGEELMAWLFTESYRAAAAPLRVYALLLPLRAAVYGSVLMAAGLSRWVTLTALAALAANALLNALLVPRLGAIGAAWATVGTTYASVALTLWPMSRALGVGAGALIPWGGVLRPYALSALPLAALLPLAPTLTRAADAALGGWLGAPLGRLLALGGLYAMGALAAYRLGGLGGPRALWGRLRASR